MVLFSKMSKRKNRVPTISAELLPMCEKPLHVLIITDTHSHATVEKMNDFLDEDVGPIDVIFTLGDIDYRDFEAINQCEKLKNIPRYGILGNHDYYSILKENNVQSIHGEAITLNGIRFAGMYGSIRYKNTTAPMFTDEESIQVADMIPECDVFLTHDKAKAENEEPRNFSHGGMIGIWKYIKKNKPVIHLHGHLHENMCEHIDNTLSYGICRYAYIIFNKQGIHIKKIIGNDFIKIN